jgi:hypothetical protein
VFSIDEPERPSPDEAMAERVARQVAAAPSAICLVLAGNVHTRTVVGAPWDSGYRPMGSILRAQHALVALNGVPSDGTAWLATRAEQTTGEVDAVYRNPERGEAGEIVFYSSPDEWGYDGELQLGTVTASPPAFRTSFEME